MIYGELGIMPIIVDIKARIASFSSQLIDPIDGTKKYFRNLRCNFSYVQKLSLQI